MKYLLCREKVEETDLMVDQVHQGLKETMEHQENLADQAHLVPLVHKEREVHQAQLGPKVEYINKTEQILLI